MTTVKSFHNYKYYNKLIIKMKTFILSPPKKYLTHTNSSEIVEEVKVNSFSVLILLLYPND